MFPHHSRLRLAVLTATAIALLQLPTAVYAAPHFGDYWQLRQPNGEMIEVRIWGDEFYQVVESLDGRTLVRDPMTSEICYAKLSNDRATLLSTGLRVGSVAPSALGIPAHIRIDPVEMQKVVAAARENFELPWQREVARQPGALAAPPANGNVRGICLIVDFSDRVGTIPRNDVANFLNQAGYTGNGNNGSVMDYFADVSNGNLTYTNYVPAAYQRASRPFSYYDDCTLSAGTRARELVVEILNQMETAGFDFSGYDSNHDGYIDAINVFYVGNTTCGWAMGMWPHAGGVSGWSADGVSAGAYQITGMGTSLNLGTFCHENGHMICSWPDLYDYNYDATGIGRYCLMAYGGSGTNPVEPCGYLKNTVGWETVTDLTTNQVGLSLAASNTNACYKYDNPLLPEEYFLIENRQKSGRDASLPDAGLAVWHIDTRGNNSANQRKPAPSEHYRVTLVQADGNWHLENNINYGDATDLWKAPSFTALNACTSPNTNWWDGTISGMALSNISVSSTSMSFDFNYSNPSNVAVCRNGTDVVFLLDVTGSTGELLPLWKDYIRDIVVPTWQSYDSNVRFGLASHLDFPFYPCGAPGEWAYRMESPLNPDITPLLTALDNLGNQSGADAPESQYEAIYQLLTGAGRDLVDPVNYTDPGEIPPSNIGQQSPMLIYHFTFPELFHNRDLESNYPFAGSKAVAGRTLVLNELTARAASTMFIGLTFISGPPKPGERTDPQFPGDVVYPRSLLDDLGPLAEMAAATGGEVYNVGQNLENLQAAITASVNLWSGSVQGNSPPDCSRAFPSIAEIWPPNHQMVDVTIEGVSDPDGDPLSITILAISQDEPVLGHGSGHKSVDGAGIGTSVAQVRAERSGQGNGRVYRIYYEAADPDGAVCRSSVTVCVAHDQGEGSGPGGDVAPSKLGTGGTPPPPPPPGQEVGACIDDGTIYDSTEDVPHRGRDSKTSVDELLVRCYPNPFNPSTTIEYALPQSSQVSVTIHNVAGRRVRQLVNDHQNVGMHSVIWDGKDGFGRAAASGIYIFSVRAGSVEKSKRILLLK